MVSNRITPNSTEMPVNVVGSSQFGRYSKISSEFTENMFITTAGAPNTEDFEAWLVNFPGFRRVLNFTPAPSSSGGYYPDELPVGSGRSLFNSIRGNFALAVINATVYRVAPNLSFTPIGIISSSSGDVYMAENLNSQIAIVDGTNCWIYYYGVPSSFTQQMLSNNLVANYVKYHNTFFLFGNADKTSNGAKWYVYLPSGTANIAQVNLNTSGLALQTKSDYALAVVPIPGAGNNVLVMGSTVCEVWTQQNGLQPYVRQPSVNINYGCLSVGTISEGGELLVWLGANEDEAPVIMVYDGREAKSVSTDGIDYLLSTIKYPQTSTAMLYRQDGHLFYQLTFYNPADNLTLIYDFDTQMFFNLTNERSQFHPARQIIYFNLNVYFVSIRNTALYQLSSNFTTINENLPNASVPELIYDIPRTRVTSSIRQANSTRFRANSLVLTLEQGVDTDYADINKQLAVGQYLITEATNIPALDNIITEGGQQMIVENPSDAVLGVDNGDYSYNYAPYDVFFYQPKILLSISKDGGITWSSDVERTLMPLGHRQNILQWEGMGTANDLRFRFRFYGTSRFIVSNAMCQVIL